MLAPPGHRIEHETNLPAAWRRVSPLSGRTVIVPENWSHDNSTTMPDPINTVMRSVVRIRLLRDLLGEQAGKSRTASWASEQAPPRDFLECNGREDCDCTGCSAIRRCSNLIRCCIGASSDLRSQHSPSRVNPVSASASGRSEAVVREQFGAATAATDQRSCGSDQHVRCQERGETLKLSALQRQEEVEESSLDEQNSSRVP
eukprot:746723-Hanusia_phi.AAC.1